jgi:hypothetical protein
MRFVRLIALIAFFTMAIAIAGCGQDGEPGQVITYRPGAGLDQDIPPDQQDGNAGMVLTSIDPALGTPGTTVNLYGENFVAGVAVQLCGVASRSVTLASAGEIHFTVPSAGFANKDCAVKVTAPDGTYVQSGMIFYYVAPGIDYPDDPPIGCPHCHIP